MVCRPINREKDAIHVHVVMKKVQLGYEMVQLAAVFSERKVLTLSWAEATLVLRVQLLSGGGEVTSIHFYRT